MGRVEPAAEADLDDGQVDGLLGEPAEGERGQQLELGWLAQAPGDPLGRRPGHADQPGELGRLDQPAGDLEPLAIGHEVRLGRLAGTQAGRAQDARDEGQDAALAVRAADQRSPEGELGIAQLAQQGPGPAEAQANPEAAALVEGGQCLGVGQLTHVR